MIYSDFRGAKISRLGFGTMRLPMKENKQIDFEAGCEMIDYAITRGINYFDTAYRYHEGQAEFFVRDALSKRYPREKFFLADKMPVWFCKEEADAPKIFEEQLSNCGVEYFDFYLLHSISEGEWPSTVKNKVCEYLKSQKDAGRIKHLGMSVHCQPTLLREILEQYGDILEFVQIQMNYMDWDYINAKELHQILLDFDKAIIIMEPLRGGMLASPASPQAREILDRAAVSKDGTVSMDAAACAKSMDAAVSKDGRKLSYADFALGYVNQLPNVVVTLSGMSTLEQVKENIEFFNDPALTDDQLKAVQDAGKALGKEILIPCTGCNYCYDCPAEIKIPRIFKGYNEASMKGFHYIWGSLSGIYKGLGPNADDCLQCGACESVCPQNIDIIEKLKEIHQKYQELEKIGE